MKTNKNYYSVSEIDFIVQNYTTMSCAKIAKNLNRSSISVYRKLRTLSCYQPNIKNQWSVEEIEKLKELLLNEHSITDIAKILNKKYKNTKKQALKCIVNNNLSIDLKNRRKYNNNQGKIRPINIHKFYSSLRTAIWNGTAKAQCCLCEYQKYIELHHLDGDRKNNHISNIVSLCRNHHKEVEELEHDTKKLMCVWWRISNGVALEVQNNKEFLPHFILQNAGV